MVDGIASQPWINAGRVDELDTITSKYPHDQYDWGIGYNGFIRNVIVSSWNQGTRITAFPNYPQGDSLTGLDFGTTVIVTGLEGQEHAYQQYVRSN